MGKIIALSGYKGSGKDSMAQMLTDFGFKRIAFADVLKDMVAEQYGIDRSWMDDQNKKEIPLTTFPIDPQDDFSKMIADRMLPEFRTIDGIQFYPKPMPLFEGNIGSRVRLYHTPRSLLILEGSIKRSVKSNYWVQRALSKLEKGKKYVITDMRYVSEATQIIEFSEKNDFDTVTVRILREPPRSTDPSERDLDRYNFDITVDNTGTLQELSESVRYLAKEVGV